MYARTKKLDSPCIAAPQHQLHLTAREQIPDVSIANQVAGFKNKRRFREYNTWTYCQIVVTRDSSTEEWSAIQARCDD